MFSSVTASFGLASSSVLILLRRIFPNHFTANDFPVVQRDQLLKAKFLLVVLSTHEIRLKKKEKKSFAQIYVTPIADTNNFQVILTKNNMELFLIRPFMCYSTNFSA